MINLFLKIYDSLVRHKAATAIATLLLLACCTFLATKMEYDEDISAFVPMDEANREYVQIFEDIGGSERIAIIFKSKNNDSEAITEAMERFGQSVAKRDTSKVIKDLQVVAESDAIMQMLRELWQFYPLLLTEDDYRLLDSLAGEPDYLLRQMEQNKMMLMLPTAGMIAQSLPYDPLQLSGRIASRLAKLGENSSFESYNGYLFKEGRGIALLTSPHGMSESRLNQELQQLLDSCINDALQNSTSLEISSVGAPLIAATNAGQIKKDTFVAIILATLLILALLIYNFRRATDLLWIVVTLAAGWLFALGAVSLIRESISLIVIGIGSIIIGIAVNYPLHFIDHLKYEHNIRDILKEMVSPLLVGNITTVSAFLSLLLLDAKAMRDLGLFASLMLVGTILFTLICLPLFLKPYKEGGARGKSIALGSVSLFGMKNRRGLFFGAIVLLTILFWFFGRNASFDSNMQNINYMKEQQRQDLAFLASGTTQQTLFAGAKGATLEQAIANNEKLCRILKENEVVEAVSGVDGIIISEELAEERAKRWQTFIESHSILERLGKAALSEGFTPQAFAPFFALSTEPATLLKNYKESTALQEIIGKEFIVENSGEFIVVNFVTPPNGNLETVKENISAILPEDCLIFSQSEVSGHLAQLLSDSFNEIGFICGVIVFLFLWLSFRSIEIAIISFLPLAVSWIWILGIMELLGIEFNIVNIILATFIFGQGDDYTIFITEGLLYEYKTGKRRIEQYKNSVATSAIVMFIGIGVLIFGKHPAMRSLAEVAMIGMVTVVFMAYTLPPLLFDYLTKKKGKLREHPITLYRLAVTAFSLTTFVASMFCFMIPYTLLIYKPLKWFGKGEKSYHKLLQKGAHFVIRHIPGVKFNEVWQEREDFSKPAVIICNHQSHLDVMAIMQLSAKIIILTNDWVWKNPFYGIVIHAAEFHPVSNGYGNNIEKIKDLVARGYSIVVFPEGTRTPDGAIGRFHKGAFTLARELNLDILPLCLKGLYEVMPKDDIILRRGSVTLEVWKRISIDTFAGLTEREAASKMREEYKKRYDRAL